MPEISLTFPSLNLSAQIGDKAYYSSTSDDNQDAMNTSGGFSYGSWSTYTYMGTIINIIPNVNASGVLETGGTSVNIIIDMLDEVQPPTENNFIFFVKDHTVNMSSIRGYYGEVEFRNYSTSKAEMFATACEVAESSK